MSILIKGMTAKELLDVFQWARIGANNCMIGYGVVATELPDHGDLIDRDEAADDACLIWGRNSSGDDAVQEIIEHLREMKAVIPAERSEASLCDNCDQRNDKGCCVCKYIKERSEEDENWYTELDDPKIAERSEE